MRLALLAKRESIHTVRWVNALAARGHDVHLISALSSGEPLDERVTFHVLPIRPPAGFLLNVLALRSLLARIQPDVLNTHYASGYGTLARLSGFHPNVLSVWGSDVYDFPYKSPLHRRAIVDNLRAADWICSTSEVMAAQTRSLRAVDRLSVIPFGIDIERFRPMMWPDDGTIVVGTVKSLADKYGIDVLIRAFAIARELLAASAPELADRLRLSIVGTGPAEASLKALSQELGLAKVVRFAGAVPHSEVPAALATMDVFAALSRLDSESFGVAILEASACGLPVVVSDAGGLPEVVVDGKSGFVVPREDPTAAAMALIELIEHETVREEMGTFGRQHVVNNYSWDHCVGLAEEVYRQMARAGTAAVRG